VLLSLAALFVRKKNSLYPIIVAAILIPMDQRIVVAGADFTVLRFLVLAYVVRIFLRNERRVLRPNSFDKLYFAWQITESAVYVLQHGSTSALVYRCGVLFDMLGVYWIMRQQITSWASVQEALRIVAYCAIASAPLMLWEYITREGPYAAIFGAGGDFHRGRYRCAGPFPHYIMMGLFWASVVPFFIYLYRERRQKLYLFALLSAMVCIVTSGSSTPLLTLGVIFAFGFLYRYRYFGRQIFWGLIAALVCIHFIKEKPVWHIFAQVNVFGGSTGWHRYHLIDAFINRFTEWFLLGVRGTSHWGYGLADVTNQFVLTGVRGGIVSLLLFIALCTLTIRAPAILSHNPNYRDYHRFFWACTVVGIAHVVSFFGVSYFGQIMLQLILFYSIIALIVEKRAFIPRA
jgi:hypothetical protein